MLFRSDTPGECDVQVVADGQVGGMIAGVAQRLLGGVATMMMNQFFECLRGKAALARG